MTMFRKNESGKGGPGAIMAFVILAVVLFLAYKLIPVYIHIYAFEDFVTQGATHWGASPRITEDDITREILKKADELHIPMTANQVNVHLAYKRISVRVNYTLPIEFPGYTWNKRVTVEYQGQRFI